MLPCETTRHDIRAADNTTNRRLVDEPFQIVRKCNAREPSKSGVEELCYPNAFWTYVARHLPLAILSNESCLATFEAILSTESLTTGPEVART